jgi:hypothetical protein
MSLIITVGESKIFIITSKFHTTQMPLIGIIK